VAVVLMLAPLAARGRGAIFQANVSGRLVILTAQTRNDR
jgi:hypothetical protein